MFKLIKFILVASFLTIGVKILANGQGKETIYLPMDELVVTATRTENLTRNVPVSVSVISRQQLENINPKDLEDALKTVLGLKIQSYGALGKNKSVHIRGLYGVHTLIMLDGIPLNSPSLGMTDLSWIPIDNIAKIEIVRGPGSALYGSNAVAGIVNIITLNKVPKLNLSLTYGSWNTILTDIQTGLDLGKFNYTVTGNFKSSQGYRDNDQYLNGCLSSKLQYTFSPEHQVTLGLSYQNDKSNWPGVKPSTDTTKRNITQQELGNDEVSSLSDYGKDGKGYFNLDYKITNFRFKLYLNDWRQDTYRKWVELNLNTWNKENNEQTDNFRTYVYGSEFIYSTELFRYNLTTVGTNIDKYEFKVIGLKSNLTTPGNSEINWSATRTNLAVYIQDEFTITPLKIIAGMRYDQPSDFPAQLSLKSGLIYNFTHNSVLKFSYGDAFRAPTLNDIYWPEDPFSQGNLNLIPEKGRVYELGIESNLTRNLFVRTAIFRQEVRDMITWAPTGPQGLYGPKWQPTNLNQAEITGTELESKFKWVDFINLSLGYTYLAAYQKNREVINAVTNEMVENKRILAYSHQHKLDLNLTVTNLFGLKDLYTGLDFQFQSESYQYFANYNNYPTVTIDTRKLPAFSLINLRVRKNLTDILSIYFNLDNLLDQRYILQAGATVDDGAYPMPGRSLNVGLNVKI